MRFSFFLCESYFDFLNLDENYYHETETDCSDLLYIVLNAKQFDELFLVAGEAWLESLKVNHDCLYDALVVVFIAVNAVGGAQDLSIDGAVIVDDFEEFIEELNPLLFLGIVDVVSGFLVQKLRLDDHRDDT